MGWFQKLRQPDPWEVAIGESLGDIEGAQKIREICACAESISDKMTALRGRKAEQAKAAEAERYQAAVKRALEIARQISDDSMRDVSLSQIVRLCVKADHLKTARILLRAIHSEKAASELIAENPVLADQDTAR